LIRSLVTHGGADLPTDRVQRGDAADLEVRGHHDMDLNEAGAPNLGDIAGVSPETVAADDVVHHRVDLLIARNLTALIPGSILIIKVVYWIAFRYCRALDSP